MRFTLLTSIFHLSIILCQLHTLSRNCTIQTVCNPVLNRIAIIDIFFSLYLLCIHYLQDKITRFYTNLKQKINRRYCVENIRKREHHLKLNKLIKKGPTKMFTHYKQYVIFMFINKKVTFKKSQTDKLQKMSLNRIKQGKKTSYTKDVHKKLNQWNTHRFLIVSKSCGECTIYHRYWHFAANTIQY